MDNVKKPGRRKELVNMAADDMIDPQLWDQVFNFIYSWHRADCTFEKNSYAPYSRNPVVFG